MKAGDTKVIHGFIVQAEEGKPGCNDCHLCSDRPHYTIKERLSMLRMCNNIPVNCVDAPICYKIVGVAE